MFVCLASILFAVLTRESHWAHLDAKRKKKNYKNHIRIIGEQEQLAKNYKYILKFNRIAPEKTEPVPEEERGMVKFFKRLSRKIEKGAEKLFERLRDIFTPFQVFLVGFFLSVVLLFIPLYAHGYFGFGAGDWDFVGIVKMIFLSFHNTMRLFILDGDFDLIRDTVTAEAFGELFAGTYNVYFALIFVLAPVFTAGFALSFVKSIAASVSYLLHIRKSDIYILSELNERSLTLAKDILNNDNIPGRKMVMFADVVEKEDNLKFELAEEAKRLGAICFRKDITQLRMKPWWRNVKRKLYFIGTDEDKNLSQALSMIESCLDDKRYNNENTQLYVFSYSAESEVLLSSAKHGSMKVRRVLQSRNLAIDTLIRHSLFANAIEKDGEKDGKKIIGIAIVGLGSYGTELFKAVCWCGQVEGYKMKIHIYEKATNAKSRIKSMMPGLFTKSGKMCAESLDIVFHEGVNVNDTSFIDKLSKEDDISTVYVTLGDDELNIATAIRMRMQFGRNNNKLAEPRPLPKIFALVYNPVKSEVIGKSGGLHTIEDKPYGIEFIGSIAERYSLDFIEHEELEELASMFHKGWSINTNPFKKDDEEEKKKKYPNMTTEQIAKLEEESLKQKTESFNQYEYFRRSSIAQALFAAHLHELGILVLEKFAEDEERGVTEYADRIGKLEHNRWSVYMRTEGYVYGKEKDYINKTHGDLVSNAELAENRKLLDHYTALSDSDEE